MSTDTRNSAKEHFYISRKARNRYHLDDPDLLRLSPERHEAMAQAEREAETINRQITLIEGEHARTILPAQLHGMKLLHELLHQIIGRVSGLSGKALSLLDQDASRWHTLEYLGNFLELFPPWELYRSKQTPEEYLHQGSVNLADVLEEAFLVWINNQNPALEHLSGLVSDQELRYNPAYPHLVRAMKLAMQSSGPIGETGSDLDELLSLPFRHAPDSLLDQLRYIRVHWKELLTDSAWWHLLDEAIVLIEDEDRYLFFENLAIEHHEHPGAPGDRDVHAPSYANLADAPARYSHDSSWMPDVVMIAKSTYVWLDQLSRQYGRDVRRLQDIPDEELDLLAKRGFTALWLIGLWQRSHASQKIKQLQGNQEAKASAYALENYEIADELGSYEGYLDLRNRAMQRGIRLASDMVPNHTGIDSELVRQRPEWFLSSSMPPYPNYAYTGPNLSADSRYGIQIEDGYWNRSDAAVTFKRTDHLTGDTRYLYHGNDGTTMPWNDTAQLNFLDPEVREGVIRQILHVARMFPIIRFDAAMVLAKIHIQRLWFPLPGHASGVPSRSAWAMSMADFEAAMPEEFWREVVDRVAREVPDTLLLAEAFWMLEGYFVRTLGMHRVYNSAFMHMLKKEDNAGYRQLIKSTLEFDAEILKRYVNFMNNPDEETAIAQFGNSDKYFGVCMVMLTMPGLPMFGHGQIEGFTEKYGMEYARAKYDEQPDLELVRRHEREVFPVMKQRGLFAEVAKFHLFDLYASSGEVNENVFAYVNSAEGAHALFIYNNRMEASDGWIRMSAARLENGSLRQTTLADALDLPDDHDAFVLFRDHRSGLEFIRSCIELRQHGLYAGLNGYQYNLFLDFRIVRPTKLTPYDRLCRELDGKGVLSVELEALSASLRPIHRLLASGLGQWLKETSQDSLENRQIATLFGATCQSMLEELSVVFEAITETPLTIPADIAETLGARYLTALEQAVVLDGTTENRRLKRSLGIGTEDHEVFRQMAGILIGLDTIQELLQSRGLLQRQLIDQWLLGETLSEMVPETGSWPVNGPELVDLFSCLLSLQSQPEEQESPYERIMHSIVTLFESGNAHFSSFMRFQHLHGKLWFRERRLALMASWIMLQQRLRSEETAEAIEEETPVETVMPASVEAFEKLESAAFLCGYELHCLLKG